MGCLADFDLVDLDCLGITDRISFKETDEMKDGLKVYESWGLGYYIGCPVCHKEIRDEERKELYNKSPKKSIASKQDAIHDYIKAINSWTVDIFPELRGYYFIIEGKNNNNYLKFYCRKRKVYCYIKFVSDSYERETKLVIPSYLDQRYHYNIWEGNKKIINELIALREEENRLRKYRSAYLSSWEEEQIRKSNIDIDELKSRIKRYLDDVDYVSADLAIERTRDVINNYPYNVCYAVKKELFEYAATFADEGSHDDIIREARISDEEEHDLLNYIRKREGK